MIQINWTQSTETSWYAYHGELLLKKHSWGGRDFYQIWKDGTMIQSTTYIEAVIFKLQRYCGKEAA